MSEFDAFAERMSKLAESVVHNTEKHVRAAALIADSTVVQATPVDTGRARANWTLSIGSPVFADRPSPGPGAAGPDAVSAANGVLQQWRVGSGPICISNGLPYITRLDTGYSAQAPNGMTAQAINAARAYLQQHAKLLER